jgi:hypothetical protein
MNAPQIPTPEAGDTPGDETPSFSPSASESASKRRKRTAACGGDTLTPGDEIPRFLRQQGVGVARVTPPVTRASGAHLEPVDQHKLDDDAKIPEFLRRQGVHAARPQPIAIEWEASKRRQADQPSGFVPSILRRPENADLLRGAGVVTPPVTSSPAPPVAASVTPAVTVAPAIGSICPTCNCRVPARLNAAERQRAYRERQREKLVAATTLHPTGL